MSAACTARVTSRAVRGTSATTASRATFTTPTRSCGLSWSANAPFSDFSARSSTCVGTDLLASATTSTHTPSPFHAIDGCASASASAATSSERIDEEAMARAVPVA